MKFAITPLARPQNSRSFSESLRTCLRTGNPGWQEDFRSDLLEQSFHPGFAPGALETAWDESTTRCPKDSNTAPEDQIPDFGG